MYGVSIGVGVGFFFKVKKAKKALALALALAIYNGKEGRESVGIGYQIKSAKANAKANKLIN